MPVGVGLAISGVGAYAFLALASHTLTPTRYASLATLWSLTFLIWPGSFLALERETARRLAITEVNGAHDEGSLLDIYFFGGVLIAVVLLFILSAHSFLNHLFLGDRWMTIDLALAGPSVALQFIAFGVLSGNSRFADYSTVWVLEGAGRLGLALLLVLFGVHTAGPFGLALAIAPMIALLGTSKGLKQCRRTAPGLRRSGTMSMVWALASNLCFALLVNSGPALVRLIGPNEPAVLTGRFLSALVIVRVPLFLYAAASGPLMPALSASAAQRDWEKFREVLNRLVTLVLALTSVAVPAVAVFGPTLMKVLFGKAYVLDVLSFVILAATSGLLILCSTLSVALTAAGAVKYLFASWFSGLVAVGLFCLLPISVIRRAELALLVGSTLPAVTMGLGLYGRRVPVGSSQSGERAQLNRVQTC